VATVFRPTYSAPVPEGAKITRKRGKRVVTVTTGKGANRRTVTAAIVEGSNDSRCLIESPAWYARYVVDGKVIKKPTGETDRGEAQRRADEMEREARAMAKGGGTSAKLEIQAKRPILEHVADFIEKLRIGGAKVGYVSASEARLKLLVERCGLVVAADITHDGVERFVWELGRSMGTRNHYTRICKRFTQWMAWKKQRRLESDPLDELEEGEITDADRVRDRRALSQEDWEKFVAATAAGRTMLGMTGPHRALLYELAAGTGLRRNEAGSLTPESFNFEADPPFVRIKATVSKNSKTDDQPLTAKLVELVKGFITFKQLGPEDRLFPVQTGSRTAKMVRADLTAADIPHKVRDEVFDFHGLRVQYITNLARAGVPLMIAVKLARHADPKLTAMIYAKVDQKDKGAAVNLLPSPTTSVTLFHPCSKAVTNGHHSAQPCSIEGAGAATDDVADPDPSPSGKTQGSTHSRNGAALCSEAGGTQVEGGQGDTGFSQVERDREMAG
jgi:integrase